MAWIWAMWISLGVAGVGMILAVLTTVGLPLSLYELTPGGYLNGAQTLLLLVVALYCVRRAS